MRKVRGGRTLLSKRRALFILPVWAFASLVMWSWWLNADRVATLWLYLPLTGAMLYEFLFLPSVFLYFVMKAKMPIKPRPKKNLKVAMITLCVPASESISIVEAQLKAMSEVIYPHDSWILDEGNNKNIKKLAKKYGVKHFSRRGVAKYNQAEPPFKAKTKAGNVNAWLHRVKRYKYDYFVQLDIDHLPKPYYLDKTLGFFNNKKVAWVQAPSVYKNLDHWTSRGSAEQELVLQGPLQMGFYGNSDTPFIIGSHCTYRMSAINEIGGFQPTRAEDHLDTVVLTNHGYRGIFLPEIIAEGDGPETLDTYLAQQFAWAYSMFQVLLFHTPRLLKGMPLKKKLQFLFAQTWYPFWAFGYLLMFFTPIVGLLVNKNSADAPGWEFLPRYMLLMLASFGVWWAARPLMQPKNLRLSWRGILLHAVRWPIIVRAILAASFNIKKPYMITPKGGFASIAPTVKLYRPFLLLGLVSSFAVIWASNTYGDRAVVGQMLFALINVAFMIVICSVDLRERILASRGRMGDFNKIWLKPVSAIATLILVGTTALSSSSLVTNTSYAIAEEQVRRSEISYVDETQIPVKELNMQQIIEQISTYPADRALANENSLGIYDPASTVPLNGGYIRHSFVQWHNGRALAEELLTTKRTDTIPLITLEPRGESDGAKLYQDIVGGRYDIQILDSLQAVRAYKGDVYVRFAHEMDLANLYPWGNQDPDLYKAAHKHVVDLSRKNELSNIQWVWAPAGNDNAALYYPGDSYVDVVGTTILYDQYWYGNRYVGFKALAEKRLWLKKYSKPVWIVEFGAGHANAQYQDKLVEDAVNSYEKLGFAGLIYLNISDSNINGPDYRLNTTTNFVEDLRAAQKHPPVPSINLAIETSRVEFTQNK